MSTLFVLLANQGNQGETPPFWYQMLPILVLMMLLYFLVLRPMSRRQEQERMSRLAGLQKNDKVLTTAGIYGTVVDISDKEDVITVKVDDNVRVKMTKASVLHNISQDERIKAEKAQAQAQKGK